jgi:hypothetical protein
VPINIKKQPNLLGRLNLVIIFDRHPGLDLYRPSSYDDLNPYRELVCGKLQGQLFGYD